MYFHLRPAFGRQGVVVRSDLLALSLGAISCGAGVVGFGEDYGCGVCNFTFGG